MSWAVIGEAEDIVGSAVEELDGAQVVADCDENVTQAVTDELEDREGDR